MFSDFWWVFRVFESFCDLRHDTWDTDYISDNWEQQYGQLLCDLWIESDGDSICNSCDVCKVYLLSFASFYKVFIHPIYSFDAKSILDCLQNHSRSCVNSKTDRTVCIWGAAWVYLGSMSNYPNSKEVGFNFITSSLPISQFKRENWFGLGDNYSGYHLSCPCCSHLSITSILSSSCAVVFP